MSAEDVETSLSLAFGDLTLTVSRRARNGGTPCTAAQPPGPGASASAASAAPAPAPGAAPSQDAEAWATREQRASEVGAQAGAWLRDERGEPSRLPRTAKANRCYVVLRSATGFLYEPALVEAKWARVSGLVLEGDGRPARQAVFAAFASEREAKCYVAAAGARWP